MLKAITHLKGFSIRSTDAVLGAVEHMYFDDETWTIRYLTVDTGGWLAGRRVLISPFSIRGVDWNARRVDVLLTRKEVENSPNIDTHQPVSRQHEANYLGIMGYPYYWLGPWEWASSEYPVRVPQRVTETPQAIADRAKRESKDSHLRSTAGVSGYDIQALDGEIGHICGFVLDDLTWSIRYIEIATRNWWPGKKVLLSPAWIQRVSWLNSKLYVSLSRAAIQTAPAYVDSLPLTREFENDLYHHYGRPPYWERSSEPAEMQLLNR